MIRADFPGLLKYLILYWYREKDFMSAGAEAQKDRDRDPALGKGACSPGSVVQVE